MIIEGQMANIGMSYEGTTSSVGRFF